MDRIQFASEILKSMPPAASLLDVGCRDGSLVDRLPPSTAYFGADLFQNERGNVAFLGDIQKMEVGRKFEYVLALDILEHVDDLHGLFDRLVGMMESRLMVSLPNCYDLKSRFNFVFKGALGGKYRLKADPSLDRHRWVVGDAEIISFFESKARAHHLHLAIHRMKYGDWASPSLASRVRACSRWILPDRLSTSTVFGVFSRQLLV